MGVQPRYDEACENTCCLSYFKALGRAAQQRCRLMTNDRSARMVATLLTSLMAALNINSPFQESTLGVFFPLLQCFDWTGFKPLVLWKPYEIFASPTQRGSALWTLVSSPPRTSLASASQSSQPSLEILCCLPSPPLEVGAVWTKLLGSLGVPVKRWVGILSERK